MSEGRQAIEPVHADDGLVGLDRAVSEIVERLGRSHPATVCLVGESGSGRTATLRALAARVAEGDGPLAGTEILRLRPEAVVGGARGAALRELAQKGEQGAIVAVDDLEVVLQLASPATDLDIRGAVRSLVGRDDLRTVLTLDSSFRARLESEEAELYGELSFVELPTLDAETLGRLGERHAWALATETGVGVPVELVELALRPRQRGDLRTHPGLMMERLDHAATRARVRGADRAEVEDLELDPASARRESVEPAKLRESLRARIAGQDEAVEGVASRLGLTKVGLDLRPHRPDGVFLFAGPTGVGKTALAKALAQALHGDADEHLIRLDMSEYSEEWSTTRIYGPHPGYIGSDSPSGWLTTKVLERPNSVVLLDEIEKAHPDVWNSFLQIFDDGRLTDSKGRTVSFARTVMIMTSNAGARAFGANPIGFGDQDDRARTDDAVAGVRAALERLMPPEFLNRIDEILVFRPLPAEVISEIAQMEVARAIDSLAERGWELEIGDEVVELVATEGYDPTYGARHLQRNIERMLLQGLSGKEPGAYAASLEGEGVRWLPG